MSVSFLDMQTLTIGDVFSSARFMISWHFLSDGVKFYKMHYLPQQQIKLMSQQRLLLV